MNRNLTSLILIALGVGLYFTFTSGLLSDAQAVRNINLQYASALNNAATLITARDQVLKQFNSIAPTDQDRLDKMLPSTVDNIRLVIDLNNVALRHGFSLNSIKAGAAEGSNAKAGATTLPAPAAPAGSLVSSNNSVNISTPTLDKVMISFGASATYDQFISFMQDLEADLRIMDVTHLSVTAHDNGVYDFQVQMQTYWLRQS